MFITKMKIWNWLWLVESLSDSYWTYFERVSWSAVSVSYSSHILGITLQTWFAALLSSWHTPKYPCEWGRTHDTHQALVMSRSVGAFFQKSSFFFDWYTKKLFVELPLIKDFGLLYKIRSCIFEANQE